MCKLAGIDANNYKRKVAHPTAYVLWALLFLFIASRLGLDNCRFTSQRTFLLRGTCDRRYHKLRTTLFCLVLQQCKNRHSLISSYQPSTKTLNDTNRLDFALFAPLNPSAFNSHRLPCPSSFLRSSSPSHCRSSPPPSLPITTTMICQQNKAQAGQFTRSSSSRRRRRRRSRL